eukprot:CAMPEP_0194130238 /NCGR_PEP_ID=MMETSP0152-20130528/1315_1 /TAXON_ID=1049557 /ORGANISM="Thalassiothrix antarctica, Strain L6-D1" /LENGTH=408 /DNA_ID=CAMNT_0038824679 /DNA_START=56 /DNA_END=1282 /DNA_ORIENTATION=+
MSGKRDDDDNEEEASRMPTWDRPGMPMNVNTSNDDIDDDGPTRRIGATPSFSNTMFSPQLPSAQTTGPSTFSRIQQKPTAITAAPKVKSPPPLISSAPGGWKLKNAPTLPKFHPLDRASVFCGNTSVSLVAGRIANVLRDRSIEGHFDNSKAKVRCLTSYNVDFRIFLYRGQKRYSHGVIVEVQRRYGASVMFFQDSKAILDAAQGKIVAPMKQTTAQLPLVDDPDDEFDDSKAAISSLTFVEKMLLYERMDATLLGLQTLSSLTDPEKMGKSTANRVSECIVTDGNTVGGKVFEIITTRKPTEEDTEVHYDLAMSITANVLRNVRGKVSEFHRNAIRPILVRDMENAEKKPQRAFAAARCLDSLLASDQCATDLYVVLEHCKDVGEARHSALRVQAEKCMRLIDESR